MHGCMWWLNALFPQSSRIYGAGSGQSCMYLLRKYQMLQSVNLLRLHLLDSSGIIPSGAQSHSQHLSACLVMVHRMTSSAV